MKQHISKIGVVEVKVLKSWFQKNPDAVSGVYCYRCEGKSPIAGEIGVRTSTGDWLFFDDEEVSIGGLTQ